MKKGYIDKVIIGTSDYTREQMENGESAGAFGTSAEDFINVIESYEEDGYDVFFKRNPFRLFAMGKYRVIAYRKE